MINRIFKNKKTTAVGIGIILITFGLVYSGKATLTEMTLFLTGGFALIFSEDKK